MKRHMMMASAAALAFATGAIAQQAASPAEPNSTAAGATTSTDANASTGQAATTTPDAAAGATSGTPTDSTAATSPSTTSDMAATPPASDAASAAAAPTPAAPATPDAQTAAGTAAPAAVDPAKAQAADQMIAQNWSKYDAEGKGQLTPLEFGTWVLAAQGNDMSAQIEKSRQSRQANLPSTKVLNATAAEFSKADTNKDRAISQDELRTYLAG